MWYRIQAWCGQLLEIWWTATLMDFLTLAALIVIVGWFASRR